jgi:hypothetical protein
MGSETTILPTTGGLKVERQARPPAKVALLYGQMFGMTPKIPRSSNPEMMHALPNT